MRTEDGSLSEIDQVRYQRDVARAENERLRKANIRLTELLHHAEEAIKDEYQLRVRQRRGVSNGNV